MCHKIGKKCCSLLLFAALLGGAVYVLECLKRKAQAGWEQSGGQVKAAARNIREDMGDMKDAVESVVEDGVRA